MKLERLRYFGVCQWYAQAVSKSLLTKPSCGLSG